MEQGTTPRQIVVSVLLRRTGPKLDLKIARSARFGEPVTLEAEHTATMDQIEELFCAVCGPCLVEIFRELRADKAAGPGSF